MDKHLIDNFLGIKTDHWLEIKGLINTWCSGEAERFIFRFQSDKDNIRSLHMKVDQLQREIADKDKTISSLRKHRNELQKEIADLKQPLLIPLITTTIRCVSLNVRGYRCRGDAEGIDQKVWCLQCTCYDPE